MNIIALNDVSDDRVSNEHLRPRITDEHIGRPFCSQFACTQLYVCKHARADVFVYAMALFFVIKCKHSRPEYENWT